MQRLRGKLIRLCLIGLVPTTAQISFSHSTSVESITCVPVDTAPTIDGDTSDWSSVESFETPLTGALSSTEYPHGNGHVTVRCVYDEDRIYLLYEVPGPYRFDSADYHKCASISTMFKMGSEAMLYVSKMNE